MCMQEHCKAGACYCAYSSCGTCNVDAMLEVIPSAPVAHLGMYRDETTHKPIEYYAKMPGYIAERQVLLVDPMLATGGSICAALHALRNRGVKDITIMVIVAAPEGIRTVLDADPDVRIYTCALDEGLTRMPILFLGWAMREIASFKRRELQ